jgi:hypothetical protein
MLERVQAPLEAIGQRRTGSLGAPDVAALLRHLDTVRSGT